VLLIFELGNVRKKQTDGQMNRRTGKRRNATYWDGRIIK